MHLKPEHLALHRYVLQDAVSHHDIVPFIRTYLKKKTISATLYWVFNAVFALAIIAKICWDIKTEAVTPEEIMTHMAYGFALTFCLIPVHELIHVGTYKILGAEKTSMGMNLRRFYFMAVADKFVASRREFVLVAAAPFLVISTLVFSTMFLADREWIYTCMSILLIHTACCSGDFGLISYFEYHNDRKVVTYDDQENHLTYFYARPREARQTNMSII